MNAPTALLADAVKIINGKPVTNTVRVARIFGKLHKNVMRKVELTKLDCPEEFNRLNFEPVVYSDLKGETRPAYRLTKDAFVLLAMSFTGYQAMQFKLAYIAAFNAMAEELAKKQAETALAATKSTLPASVTGPTLPDYPRAAQWPPNVSCMANLAVTDLVLKLWEQGYEVRGAFHELAYLCNLADAAKRYSYGTLLVSADRRYLPAGVEAPHQYRVGSKRIAQAIAVRKL